MILFDERFIVENSKTAQFARLGIIFDFVIIFVRYDSPGCVMRKHWRSPDGGVGEISEIYSEQQARLCGT